MRIVRFTGNKLHGYLNLKVKFNKDLTFLTGINGSGKTTIVKAIGALTSPSLYTLAHMTFKRIEVEVSQTGSKSKNTSDVKSINDLKSLNVNTKINE